MYHIIFALQINFQSRQLVKMSREGALWIGGLENYMDEDFILKALQSMGETNVISIKVIKNKFTGGAAGYGFINFISDNVALTCMHKLNGKIIPGTNPPVRFDFSTIQYHQRI